MKQHAKRFTYPKHVGLIMDGNGRWANKRGQLRIDGHKKGAEALDNLTESTVRDYPEISHLTVFAFAIDNQNRSLIERQALQALFVEQTNRMLPKAIENNVRVSVVGDREDSFLSPEVKRAIATIEKGTQACDGLRLIIAWNYSGSNEIERAQLAGWSITRLYNCMLDAPDVPKMDVVIRTGVDNPVGQPWRDSDFFPLLSAKAVKVPEQVYFPEFQARMHLEHAINCWRKEAKLDGGQRQVSGRGG